MTDYANPAARALAARHRLHWAEALPWLLAVGAFFAFPSYLSLGTQVLIMVLFVLSLDLVLGYAGIVTLGHAAFFGVGAYTVGILASQVGWNEPLSGLAIAAAIAAALGALSGWILLRTTGLTLLMLTLAFMTLLYELSNELSAYTGGEDGIPGLSYSPVLGVFEFNPLTYKTQYLYVLAVLFVLFVVVRTLVYSPFGHSLKGIRENLTRMHAVGAPVRRRLVIVYTISAAIAGVAGALHVHANTHVNLEVLGLDRSATVLIILILGGYGRLYGAFIGAVVYLLLQDELSKAFPTEWQFGLGLLLVVIALFARNGILGLVEKLSQRLSRKRGS